jgi:2-polyprenyl-6-methoxyphenol hydroxylase-like FAD-dependent oxidoreductase
MSSERLASEESVDVAIVGYGPVGQALAAMLGGAGHRIVVVERWPELFPLPRAGHVDDEVMRIFQSLGCGDEIAEASWELTGYELRDSQGDVLHRFDWGHQGRSGWYSDYSLFQPYLESLMHRTVSNCAGVELLRGWQVESIDCGEDDVTLSVRQGQAADGVWHPTDTTRQIQARYVVGCDGANSIVRDAMGIGRVDFGFEADWLVVFAEPNDRAMTVNMPDVAQLLEPQRPTTAFRSSGKRFCRWEFMLMPGETADEMSTPEVAWRLIERWGLTPDNSRLVRNTVFRFRSLVATDWRSGRAFIAGDAAHLMPPFLGQGMCSGLRDAKCLAWKLDLVLRGISDERLLDTYTAERRPHVESLVEASLRLGELISVIDPQLAAERDERLRTGTIAPPSPAPDLSDGVLDRGSDGAPRGPAGALSLQGIIEIDGRKGRFDDLCGGGWIVLSTGWSVEGVLGPGYRAVLEAIGARCVRVEPSPAGEAWIAGDVGGTYLPWLSTLGAQALIIRPDYYVYGAAADPDELGQLVENLAEALTLVAPAAATAPAQAD